MDYYHQSATENQVAHGLSHELYYQEKHWLEIHPLSGETSKTSARVVDKSYIGDKGASEYSASYMESCGVSESATSYSIDHYGGPYYLEVSQISDQSPIPFQGSSQMSLKKYSLNPDIDPTMKETVLQDPLSIEQTQSEPDRMREETASKTGHTLQSLNFPSNSPGKGSILKKTNRGKESKIKKKTKLQQQDLLKDNENCHGDEVPPFLKNTCPDEERFVFECLWHHRHKPNQDIWDSIQDDFFKRFRQNHSREVLHMKFSRAKSKYIQWISKDEETLRKAWEKVERDRYQLILETFYQLGGSRNMRLNPSDIEVKLAKNPTFDQQIYGGRSIKHPLSNVPAQNSSS